MRVAVGLKARRATVRRYAPASARKARRKARERQGASGDLKLKRQGSGGPGGV